MSAAFTPAPWHLYCEDADGAFEITAALPGESWGMVVVQRGGMKHRPEMAKANANLIAAAPDLYAELEHARELLAIKGVFVDAIDNALAKARGEPA